MQKLFQRQETLRILQTVTLSFVGVAFIFVFSFEQLKLKQIQEFPEAFQFTSRESLQFFKVSSWITLSLIMIFGLIKKRSLSMIASLLLIFLIGISLCTFQTHFLRLKEQRTAILKFCPQMIENLSEGYLSSLSCKKYQQQGVNCPLSQKIQHWELKQTPNLMTCFNTYCCPVLADGILRMDYYILIFLGLTNFLLLISLVMHCQVKFSLLKPAKNSILNYDLFHIIIFLIVLLIAGVIALNCMLEKQSFYNSKDIKWRSPLSHYQHSQVSSGRYFPSHVDKSNPSDILNTNVGISHLLKKSSQNNLMKKDEKSSKVRKLATQEISLSKSDFLANQGCFSLKASFDFVFQIKLDCKSECKTLNGIRVILLSQNADLVWTQKIYHNLSFLPQELILSVFSKQNAQKISQVIGIQGPSEEVNNFLNNELKICRFSPLNEPKIVVETFQINLDLSFTSATHRKTQENKGKPTHSDSVINYESISSTYQMGYHTQKHNQQEKSIQECNSKLRTIMVQYQETCLGSSGNWPDQSGNFRFTMYKPNNLNEKQKISLVGRILTMDACNATEFTPIPRVSIKMKVQNKLIGETVTDSFGKFSFMAPKYFSKLQYFITFELVKEDFMNKEVSFLIGFQSFEHLGIIYMYSASGRPVQLRNCEEQTQKHQSIGLGLQYASTDSQSTINGENQKNLKIKSIRTDKISEKIHQSYEQNNFKPDHVADVYSNPVEQLEKCQNDIQFYNNQVLNNCQFPNSLLESDNNSAESQRRHLIDQFPDDQAQLFNKVLWGSLNLTVYDLVKEQLLGGADITIFLGQQSCIANEFQDLFMKFELSEEETSVNIENLLQNDYTLVAQKKNYFKFCEVLSLRDYIFGKMDSFNIGMISMLKENLKKNSIVISFGANIENYQQQLSLGLSVQFSESEECVISFFKKKCKNGVELISTAFGQAIFIYDPEPYDYLVFVSKIPLSTQQQLKVIKDRNNYAKNPPPSGETMENAQFFNSQLSLKVFASQFSSVFKEIRFPFWDDSVVSANNFFWLSLCIDGEVGLLSAVETGKFWEKIEEKGSSNRKFYQSSIKYRNNFPPSVICSDLRKQE